MRTVAQLRERLDVARRRDGRRRTVGFVPTMGWLHDGHLSLIARARRECDVAVVSVFVNPTQFNDPADLAAYPRDEARDASLAEGAGTDLFFAPAAEEVYLPGFATAVIVRGLSEVLEGASRGAAHFHGVTTVVAKLLNMVQPDVAYFGQKDAQQALIVRQMVRDLDFPARIEVAPTVRESDGLALSSRNVRVPAADRPRALALRAGLDAAASVIAAGEREGRRIEHAGAAAMRERGVDPEYFAVVAPETLEPIARAAPEERVLIAVAARVGSVRLIDNELLTIPAPEGA